MHATRPFIQRWAWLVSLTILLAALLPSLSHAVLPDRAGALAEICSATGMRFVMLASDGSDTSDRAPGATGAMDCPYCAIHHGAPGLPPSPAAWQPPSVLRFEQPRLFLQAPRPLFAWASARARAPPSTV